MRRRPTTSPTRMLLRCSSWTSSSSTSSAGTLTRWLREPGAFRSRTTSFSSRPTGGGSSAARA
eukprot:7432694-Prorocentrum_lima.AAC.1